MARTKKIVEKSEEILLDKESVWSVLEFANSLANGMYPNVFNPMMINERMKEISYTPRAATSTDVDKALADPKNNEELLRSFVEYFEIISMPFKRILSYMSSHLSFGLTYTVKNAESSDYSSPKFKKDQKLVYEFFDKFDYIYSFRNALKQMLRNEVYVVSVREDRDRIILQELPLQYCKITARGSYAPLISFDFYYFLRPGISIDLYPEFFQRKYNELFIDRDGKMQTYNPALPPELRGNSQYVYWVDLPPDVGWVFKLDTSQITSTPYFSGMMPYLVQDSIMLSLQKDINMAAASKMLLGQVPMLKDTKANVKDMLAISPDTLGKFLALVKSSLSSAIKMTSAPLEDMKSVSFEGDNELLDKWTRTEMSVSGMDTALIYSSQVKANLVDSQLSFQSDSKIVEQMLYPQFNAFLDYWANKRTKYYKYSYRLEGNDYYLDRLQRFERAMTLADKGIVLPQLIASSLGLKPQELYRMMEESKGMKFVDMLTPIITNLQTGANAGRPEKSDDQLGEAGEQTKSAGGNLGRGGK